MEQIGNLGLGIAVALLGYLVRRVIRDLDDAKEEAEKNARNIIRLETIITERTTPHRWKN